MCKKINESKEMLERSKPENDLLALTVVLDPNTKNEQTYFKTVRRYTHSTRTKQKKFMLMKSETEWSVESEEWSCFFAISHSTLNTVKLHNFKH